MNVFLQVFARRDFKIDIFVLASNYFDHMSENAAWDGICSLAPLCADNAIPKKKQDGVSG